MNDIRGSRDGSSFSYWGQLGELALQPELPHVALRFRTEPPHGDFLYSVEVDGRIVADTAGIRLFWGRNLVLSPCGRFLGLTELAKPDGGYSVIDLASLTEWRSRGYWALCSLAYPTLKVRPWIAGAGNVAYGDEQTVDLGRGGHWTPLSFYKGADPGPMSWPPLRS